MPQKVFTSRRNLYSHAPGIIDRNMHLRGGRRPVKPPTLPKDIYLLNGVTCN